MRTILFDLAHDNPPRHFLRDCQNFCNINIVLESWRHLLHMFGASYFLID